MVYFPVRKCYHAAKIALLTILVLTLLALFEQWRGGKRNSLAAYLDPLEAEYERQILEDEARIVPGLGDGGVPVELYGREKELGEESEKRLAINVYLSDRIPYNRTLKDYRNPACKRVVYDAELPSASVILIFHNEPYSVVVRTIWSVINSVRRTNPWFQNANFMEKKTGRLTHIGYPGQEPNSPFVYLKEIILVDDNSTLVELKGKLSHYVRTRLPPDLIRILRLPDRIGLIRARLAGARYAAGDVIIFLDSHCEVQPDWLRPLLSGIKDRPHAVVVPIIDVLESRTFHYSVLDPKYFQGLMRARLRGARSARGDVLIFLDSHCEVTVDWLRPLLQRIQHKRDAVLTPIIDVIDQTTFRIEYAQAYQVGGFSFMGHFTWIDVSPRELKRRGADTSPTWSPTMAGGLFAISRDYFWELGAYDEQMGGWGGENLEMSFRIWQCGGTLETIPCSRVGHVFRKFHPYGLPAATDTHGINTARMAEVWMDDYAELFYLHRPDLRGSPLVGDVTHRKVLREKLKCKNFQWYLDNVYPEKFIPVKDVYGYGRIKNPASMLCLDTLQSEAEGAPLGLYPCHADLQATQYFSITNKGQIRDEAQCATYRHRAAEAERGAEGARVTLTACRAEERLQRWARSAAGQLRHVAADLCLTARVGTSHVSLAHCQPDNAYQIWTVDYNEDNHFTVDNGNPTSMERDEKIRRLRGQRRISRSLMSYMEPNPNMLDNQISDNGTVRRHTHKSKHHKHHGRRGKHSAPAHKRTKNKFILKLVRTLMNGTDEHLEVDIHCKHAQLYPNNTFVRDLVSILNDKNVKVINNGRVFERNKVTELDPRHSAKVLNKLDIDAPPPAPPASQPQAPVDQSPPLTMMKSQKQPSPPQSQSIISQGQFTMPGTGSSPTDTNKNFIIEDFVMMKKKHPAADPTISLRQRHKHPKHKGGGGPAPAPRARTHPPPPPPDDDSSPTQGYPRDSGELNVKGDGDDSMLIDSPTIDYNMDNAGAPIHIPYGHMKKRLHMSRAGRPRPSPPARAPPPPPAPRAPPLPPRPPRPAPHAPRPPRPDDDSSEAGDARDNALDNRPEYMISEPEPAPTARRHNSHYLPVDERTVDTDVQYIKNELTAFQPHHQMVMNQSMEQSGEQEAGPGQGAVQEVGRESRRGGMGGGGGGGAPPVKLVMRSNLTLNLADEFFDWKNKGGAAVSDFLDDITNDTMYKPERKQHDIQALQHTLEANRPMEEGPAYERDVTPEAQPDPEARDEARSDSGVASSSSSESGDD